MPEDTNEPEQSMGKELLILGCFGLAILITLVGIVGGLVYFVPQLLEEEDAPEVSEEAVAVDPATEAPAPEPSIEPEPLEEPEAVTPSLRDRIVDSEPKDTLPNELPFRLIDLSGGLGVSGESATMTITGADIMGVTLAVSDPRGKMRVGVPAGLKLSPAGSDTVCSFFVYKPKAFLASPGDGAVEVRLLAVGMDHALFFNDPAGIPMKVDGIIENEGLYEFVVLAHRKKLSWNIIQAGTWVIENNIAATTLRDLSIMLADESAADGYSASPIVSDADVEAIKAVLLELQLDPEDYALFSAAKVERDALIKAVDYDDPADNYLTVLKSRKLAQYKRDRDVDLLLRRYLRHHKRFAVREAAMQNLMEMGSSETSDRLVQRVSYGDHYSRFLVAYELFMRGDERSWPMLSIWCADPMMGTYCEDPLTAAILGNSGKMRQDGETVYGYWMRVIGWENLIAQGGDNKNWAAYLGKAKTDIDRWVAKQEDGLEESIGELGSENQSKASRAASRLRRYDRSRDAFEALCRTATGNKYEQVRKQALYSLQSFKDFNAMHVCEYVLANEREQLIYAAISVAADVQFDGHTEILESALSHPTAYVRRNALQAVSRNKIADLEKKTGMLARSDPDKGAREAAEEALAMMKSSESIRISVKLLVSKNERQMKKGFEYLRMWKDDDGAMDILEPYRDDVHIGDHVTQHLKRYGR